MQVTHKRWYSSSLATLSPMDTFKFSPQGSTELDFVVLMTSPSLSVNRKENHMLVDGKPWVLVFNTANGMIRSLSHNTMVYKTDSELIIGSRYESN